MIRCDVTDASGLTISGRVMAVCWAGSSRRIGASPRA